MFVRERWAGIALAAVLLATPCLAQQDAPASSSAAASTSARTGAGPGRGGVGGMIGASWFFASEDYSQGSQPRFDFNGHFRYAFSRRFRLQVSPGFTWNAYSKEEPPPLVDPNFPGDVTKEHYLALMVPVSAQLQVTWGKSPWHYHLGGGPGLYRVWVENHRKVLRDPVTLRLHRGVYWGATGQAGAERFLKALPNTSIEGSVALHWVVAKRDEQFPSGFNSSVGVASFRMGANYYFDLNRKKKEPELPLPAGAR